MLASIMSPKSLLFLTPCLFASLSMAAAPEPAATFSVFMMDYPATFSASVIRADAETTVYQLDCSAPAPTMTSDSNDNNPGRIRSTSTRKPKESTSFLCFTNPYATVTAGPSMYSYTYSLIEPMVKGDPVISGHGSCAITGTTKAVCTDTLYQVDRITRVASRTYEGEGAGVAGLGMGAAMGRVVVTAGVERLPAEALATATTGSGAASGTPTGTTAAPKGNGSSSSAGGIGGSLLIWAAGLAVGGWMGFGAV